MSNLTPRGTIKGVIRSGGGGGVTDYDQLTGRPSINNEVVTGDKNGHDYGLMNSNDIRITKIVDLTYGTNYDLEFPDDHVYITNQVFQPAGVSSNGTKGLVPRPSAGDTGKILSNEGWINPPESYTPPNYSTNEQKTGQKWIDGKDIYFRVVEGTGSFTTSDYFGSYSGQISPGFSFDNIWLDRNMSYLITSGGVKEGFLFMQNSNGTINLFTCATRESVDYTIIFYYTKS